MKNEILSKLLALSVILVVFVLLIAFYFLKLHAGNLQGQANHLQTLTPTPVSSGNIIVFSPTMNERVSQDFQVTGKARAFENFVAMRVKGKFGQVYLNDTAPAYGGRIGRFADFSYTAHLTSLGNNLRPNDSLILEVFRVSSKNGAE